MLATMQGMSWSITELMLNLVMHVQLNIILFPFVTLQSKIKQLSIIK